MTLVGGNDVSNYQSAAQVAAALKTSHFLIVKATEGLTYVDPLHGQHVAAARHAGRNVGHYHFAHPANDPHREAAFFLSIAKPQPGDAIALDLEADAGQSTTWTRRATFAALFLATVNAQTRARCLWYTNKSWLVGVLNAATVSERATLLASPLWIATAGLPAGKPGIVTPWAIHQFSTAGGIDHDVLAVPWDSFAIPKPAPVPPPTPTNATTTWRASMLNVFALGDDHRCASAIRGAWVTDSVADAKAAHAAGERLVVLGGPAATAIGLKAGTYGNTEVIVGQTYRDTFLAAAKFVS